MKPPPATVESLLEHGGFLRRLARAMLDEHDAEDLVQETWLRVLQKPPTATGREKWWLSRVAKRVAWRGSASAAARIDREVKVARTERTPSTLETAERLEQERAVVEAVQRLREPYRTTLVLRYLDGLKPREIAVHENTPIETVRSRIQRGLRELRKDLGPDRSCALAIACIAIGPQRIGALSGVLAMSVTQKLGAVMLAAGAVVGVTMVVTNASEPTPPRRDTEVAELRAEVAMLRGRLTDERARGAAGVASSVAAKPKPNPKDRTRAVKSKALLVKPSKEQRLRFARIAREIEVAWDEADGDATLALLRELAAELPASRDFLMKLFVGLEGHYARVGISSASWEAILAHEPIRNLQIWSLENNAPDDFRELAGWTLPWQQDTRDTVALFRRTLATEQSGDVARALLRGLSDLDTAAAKEVIRETVLNQGHPMRIRVLAIARMVTDKTAETARLLEATATTDPSRDMRLAARVVQLGQQAPATGYLIVGVRAESLAKEIGLLPGDILMSYAGQPLSAKDREAKLHIATRAKLKSNETLTIELWRNRETMKIATRSGWLGVDGRHVDEHVRSEGGK